jgi:hypothetical protein
VSRGNTYRLSSAGRASSTWRLKKLLASVVVVGAVCSVTVTSVYGLMSAQAANPRATVATGTLTFNEAVNAGTACYTYGGPSSPGNVNTACQALFTSATENYPGAPATAHVAIANNGSIDIANLSLYMPSCAAGNNATAPAPGSADPCQPGGVQFTVQETDASWAPTACWFPAGAGTCAFAANSLYVFQANVKTPANALDLGAGPAAGQTRYFAIGMQIPTNASNALQGRTATFSLTWRART